MSPELGSRPASFTGLKTPGVVVGLGEARVLKAGPWLEPDDVLVAFGLGSCVALCRWDVDMAAAGMAHVVLPGEDPSGAINPRFARSALPALISLMRAAACGSTRAKAAVSGCVRSAVPITTCKPGATHEHEPWHEFWW